MVRVRIREQRFSMYMRRDGSLGIWNPDTEAPATNAEVLGLDFDPTSDDPYWVRGSNARLIASRHVDKLNADRV